MDYSGSNDLKNLKGITKETYSKEISTNIPDYKFSKIKKSLKKKKKDN